MWFVLGKRVGKGESEHHEVWVRGESLSLALEDKRHKVCGYNPAMSVPNHFTK